MEIMFPETTNLFFGWQNKTQLEFPNVILKWMKKSIRNLRRIIFCYGSLKLLTGEKSFF